MIGLLAIVGVIAIAGHIQGYRDRQRIVVIEQSHTDLQDKHEDLKSRVLSLQDKV